MMQPRRKYSLLLMIAEKSTLKSITRISFQKCKTIASREDHKGGATPPGGTKGKRKEEREKMKIYKNKKDVIRHALYDILMDFYLNKGEEVDHEAINIELTYHPTPDRCGHFKINLYTAVQAWSTSDFKKFVEILNMSDEGPAAADLIHEFYSLTVKKLMKLKSLYDPKLDADIRKTIDTFVNKLIKMNDALSCYGIEKIEAVTAPKYKKAVVYSIASEGGKRIIAVHDGYQFEKDGYTYQVYKKNKCTYVIIPAIGLSCASFSGNIRVAHEYIEDRIIKIIQNPEKIEVANNAHKILIDLMSEAGHDIPDICNDMTIFHAPETTQEPEKKPEEPKKELKKELKKSKEIKKESKEVKKNLEASEKVKKESQNQTIKEKYQEAKNHHNESKTDYKHARRFYMTFYIDIGSNTHKSILNVSQGTTQSHTGMYAIHYFPITGETKRKAAPGSFVRFPLILASGPGILKIKILESCYLMTLLNNFIHKKGNLCGKTAPVTTTATYHYKIG